MSKVSFSSFTVSQPNWLKRESFPTISVHAGFQTALEAAVATLDPTDAVHGAASSWRRKNFGAAVSWRRQCLADVLAAVPYWPLLGKYCTVRAVPLLFFLLLQTPYWALQKYGTTSQLNNWTLLGSQEKYKNDFYGKIFLIYLKEASTAIAGIDAVVFPGGVVFTDSALDVQQDPTFCEDNSRIKIYLDIS